jgi:integrase
VRISEAAALHWEDVHLNYQEPSKSFEALSGLHFHGAKGLAFKDKRSQFLEYRQIQWRYENAFAKAGVEYRGTHALRHGGCREVNNQTGDLAVAGMLLGNQDSDTVKVYARRVPSALLKVAESAWQEIGITLPCSTLAETKSQVP